jgi:hypothetical protein
MIEYKINNHNHPNNQMNHSSDKNRNQNLTEEFKCMPPK